MRRRDFGLGIGAAFLGAAVAPGRARAGEASQRLSVGVGGQTLFSYLALPLAEQLGFFRDEGLAVTVNNFQGGSKSLEALVGGSLDAVVGAYENTVLMQPKGLDLTTVMLMTNRFGLVFALSKTASKRYAGPADLKGMRIGVTAPGSAVSNAFELILAKGGLTAKDAFIVGVGAGPSAVAAMQTGQLDGIMFSDPYITQMQQEGLLVPIVDSRQADGQDYLYGGPCACSGTYVRREVLEERGPAVQAYVSALVRATKWIVSHSAEEIADRVPADFIAGNRPLYVASLAANMGTFTPDGRISSDEAAATYHSMTLTGRLPAATKIDLSRTFDQKFTEFANKLA